MSIRKFFIVLLCLTLGACSHKPAVVEVAAPPPKPIVRKIAFLPIHEVKNVTLVNKNMVLSVLFPISAVGIGMSNNAKQPMFSEKFLAQKPNLGKDLMTSLKRDLEQDGYQVVMLEDVPRNPRDPEKLDLQKIKVDADAILHVYIDEIGFYSGNLSSNYLPILKIRAELQSTKSDEELYGETLCWGIHAKAKEGWGIVADPAISYASFDTVMAKLPEIANHFEKATQSLSKLMLARMKAELQ